MKQFVGCVLLSLFAGGAWSQETPPREVQLFCHRTANRDVPENTMDSLRYAVLLGCNVVEVDIRRTWDGVLVLDHDGVLERLTDGVGEAETTYYDDLQRRDAGSWMGERFAGIRITTFDDALRFARDHGIRLYLDIKTKGIGSDLLQSVKRADMLTRIEFGGEWGDVKSLYPEANAAHMMTVWVQPGITADQVAEHHRKSEMVVATFSANQHEMDLAGMKAAVAAGVDAINVDYPRLGADAVGRPAEQRIHTLAAEANQGSSEPRVKAILELSHYYGFPLQEDFAHWLLDPDDQVSRAAALALTMARPRPSAAVLTTALHSEHAEVRANAVWALVMLYAPVSSMLPLLQDQNATVLQAALLAISHTAGDVSAQALLPLLSDKDPGVRGAAALALARHQPEIAVAAILERLQVDMNTERSMYDSYVERGQTPLTASEIARIMGFYRSQMKMVQAFAMVRGSDATRALEEQAFRPSGDFSEMNGALAAFNLWDRIGTDPQSAVEALGSNDAQVAERAEWMLVQAGPQVLPTVRAALGSGNAEIRQRAIRIVAWQGDVDALDSLRAIEGAKAADASLAEWAMLKIQTLHPKQ